MIMPGAYYRSCEPSAPTARCGDENRSAAHAGMSERRQSPRACAETQAVAFSNDQVVRRARRRRLCKASVSIGLPDDTQAPIPFKPRQFYFLDVFNAFLT